MAQKVFACLVLLAICLAAASASPLAHSSHSATAAKNRREVIVDDLGFYLGGGANNNLREASQIYDLGGPIVNPWINAFTQPLERIGTAKRLGANGLGGYAPIAMGLGLGGIGGAGIAATGLGLHSGLTGGAIAQQLPSTLTTTTTQQGTGGVDLNLLAQLVSQLAAQQNQQQQQQTVQVQQVQQVQPVVQQEQTVVASKQLQPFTAVFLNNGQPPLFKVGLPSDYPSGYTTI